jgi:hypothetical protein
VDGTSEREAFVEQAALWDQAVQRSTVDRYFRRKLLESPDETLKAVGVDVSDRTVIVHEFSEGQRLLILPPMLEGQSAAPPPPQDTPAIGNPSPPMRGTAGVALLDPADDRVTYGGTASVSEGGRSTYVPPTTEGSGNG